MPLCLMDHPTQCYHSIRWTSLYNGIISLSWLEKSKPKIVGFLFHYLCFPADLLSQQHLCLVVPQCHVMEYPLCRTTVIFGKFLPRGFRTVLFLQQSSSATGEMATMQSQWKPLPMPCFKPCFWKTWNMQGLLPSG